MRRYQIYWINDEFAHYFYGREHNFFQLFFESSYGGSDKQTIIDKQVQHITKIFSISHVKHLINESLLKKDIDLKVKDKYFRIELANKKGTAELLVEEQCLYLKASGSYEAESIFFYSLKKMNACLFAVDFERKNFGWLEPLKKEILFK